MSDSRVTDQGVRCPGALPSGEPCNKLVADCVTRPWQLSCPRCKTKFGADDCGRYVGTGAAPARGREFIGGVVRKSS